MALLHRHRRNPAPVATITGASQTAAPAPLPAELLWLLDAPLFIDDKQVDAFFAAVLRPDYELTSIARSDSITNQSSVGGQMSIGAALPWFGKAGIQGSAGYTRTREHGTGQTLTPISNSYRHLLAMALHYAGQPAPNRLVVADPATQD